MSWRTGLTEASTIADAKAMGKDFLQRFKGSDFEKGAEQIHEMWEEYSSLCSRFSKAPDSGTKEQKHNTSKALRVTLA